jgi:L-iditol 2-dehydrogenase
VEFQPSKIMKNHLSIIGSMSADDSHYWKAMQFLSRRQSEFEFDRLLGSRFGLSGVTDALRGMQNLTEIKPVIDPGILN